LCERRVFARVLAMAAALLVPATTIAAQEARPLACVATPATSVSPRDLCQKVFDLFTFLAPQVGVALSGGNVMPGEGGTLGGAGKLSFSLHATVVDGRVPNKAVPLSVGGTAVSSDFGQQRAPIPMPSVDAAFGLIRGYTVGLTNVGGVDLLLGATYVPAVNKDPVSIRTDGRSFAMSYGVRVGILQESALSPGVSVSYRQRRLPTTSIRYATGNDTLSVDRADVKSKSLRLTAAKRFVFVGVGGGVGRDEITTTSTFSGIVSEPLVGRQTVAVSLASQKVTRSTAFVDLSFGLPVAQLTVEAGWSSKGAVQGTVNTFGGHQANEGYRYGSIAFGFRL
jgi:hypothetical protein